MIPALRWMPTRDADRDAHGRVVQIDLFIRFCLQNNGRLLAAKRASHFDFLSDEEIVCMEQAVFGRLPACRGCGAGRRKQNLERYMRHVTA